MSRIYLLKNNGSKSIATPCGTIAPGDSVVSYLHHSWYVVPFLWEDSFMNGLQAFGFAGDLIPTQEAITESYSLQALAQKTPEGGCPWNIQVSDIIVLDVRLDGLSVPDWAALGTNGSAVAQKLAPVTNLLWVGMFNEASKLLKTIPTDGYLTAEKLAIFSNMAKSADAII